MKRALLALTSLAFLNAPLLAADAPARVGKAPAAAVANAFDWTGIYFGAHGGYGFGNASGSVSLGGGCCSADIDTKGLLYGLHVGARKQIGGMVLGVRLEGSKAEIDGSGAVSGGPAGLTASHDLTYLFTGEIELGAAFDRYLPYATVGGACGRGELSLSAPIGATSRKYDSCGWTIGAGLDYAVTQRIITSLKYQYVDLRTGRPSFDVGGGFGVTVPVDYSAHVVKAGLSAKF